MDNKKLATTLETDLNNAVFALGRLTGATIEAISRLKVASGTDETVEKESERTLQKAIAIDFDGCLCANAYPDIGAPNWEIIVAAAAEQIAGADSFSGRAEREGCLRTHSKPAPDGACISTP